MVKDRKNRDENPKNSDFVMFLRKRAPIYLGLTGVFLIFLVPELTKGDLVNAFPALSAEDQQIVDILMAYNGPNESGLTVLEALSKKIDEEYPDERIYNDKKTSVNLFVSKIDSENYQVMLDFKTHKDEINYDWNVNTDSHDIESNNQESKHIIDIVDFYD